MEIDEKAIYSRLNDIMVEVETIKRGVYGDEDNEVKGLIHHHRDHLDRIMHLEDTKKKAIWFGSGAIVFLQAGWHFLLEWLRNK